MKVRANSRQMLPHEEIGAKLKFPKPQHRAAFDAQMDTSGLTYRKIHPHRDPDYLKSLHFEPCVIFGLTDNLTDQVHICWSPGDKIMGRSGVVQFRSDPMHLDKAYSGRVKRDDKDAIPGCRLAHNMQEGDTERFGRRFGIDCQRLAQEQLRAIPGAAMTVEHIVLNWIFILLYGLFCYALGVRERRKGLVT